MRTRTTLLAAVVLLVATAAAVDPAARAEMGVATGVPVEDVSPWTFKGPLGRFDQAQLRRGYQVFTEACAACHGLQYVAYRDLEALGVGFGPEDIRAIAAEHQVVDGPDENGKMFKRPARPSDLFAPPYPNDEAARVANRGMLPPDLSLITRARKGGPDYLHQFLVGYVPPPPGVEVTPGMTYNAAVSGGQTGMRPALVDEMIDYDDGTPATIDQMSRDVTAFLAWAADPHMQTRKDLGLRVVIFLMLLTIVFIALKLEVWAPLHRADRRHPDGPARPDPSVREA